MLDISSSRRGSDLTGCKRGLNRFQRGTRNSYKDDSKYERFGKSSRGIGGIFCIISSSNNPKDLESPSAAVRNIIFRRTNTMYELVLEKTRTKPLSPRTIKLQTEKGKKR